MRTSVLVPFPRKCAARIGGFMKPPQEDQLADEEGSRN